MVAHSQTKALADPRRKHERVPENGAVLDVGAVVRTSGLYPVLLRLGCQRLLDAHKQKQFPKMVNS